MATQKGVVTCAKCGAETRVDENLKIYCPVCVTKKVKKIVGSR